MSKSPFELLGLDETASPTEVDHAWKRLRSKHHPDRGGASETFNDLMVAYEKAIEISRQSVPCSTCAGSGKVEVRRGFSVIFINCSDCDGGGTKNENIRATV